MDPSKQTKPLQSPKLNTLPSELRKLIVSYLAPTCAEEMKPGCKLHLKNANLAHSCLREWVPEYMFRDMALTHVLPGASSHLEIFSLIKENAHLLKHVKHINVRVPPGIRWEVGLIGPVSMFGIEQYTQQRLCRKFGVEAIEGMLDEQLDYCTEYHEAMVAPFVENQGWFRLFRSANSTFPRVFSRFENLATLSVGCCERTDMPQPTITNTFMLQYGKSAAYEVYPNFVEDATINMAWASCSIMRSAPPSVHNLQVSLANMDCSPRTATINRLLSISYRYSPGGMDSPRPNITRLCLSIRGVSGTHGERESQGDAETAGAVNAWSLEINMMPCLQHLELIDDLSTTNNIKFSNLANSDTKASILPWLLSRVSLHELLTLRLSKFTLRKNDLQEALRVKWPKVQKIVLDNVQLRIESASSDAVAATEHHDEWIDACNFITGKQPGVQLELHNTACIVEGELSLVRIQQKQYADDLTKIPGVVLVP